MHEGARLEELRVAALEWRIEADFALGHHRDLVSELEALIAQYPLREHLRSQHMLALYRSGRHAEALAGYQTSAAHSPTSSGSSHRPRCASASA